MLFLLMVLFRLLKIPTSASLAIPRMKLQQIVSVPASSLCEPIEIFDRKMFIKRDDLHGMDSAMSEITGNKSRKLYSLSKMQPFPRLVVSSGGAQSNAMRAIAQLCYHKRSQFIYFARHLPSALLQKPVGNLRHALLLGMKLVAVSKDNEYQQLMTARSFEDIAALPCVANELPVLQDDALFIPPGAAGHMAKEGIDTLCEEIVAFIESQSSDKPWKVMFACGTGTTAFYVNKHMNENFQKRRIEVVAVPCVGDELYLQQQMRLFEEEGKTCTLPEVITACPKRAFANPYQFHFKIWQHLCASTKIDFDLLYAPRVFEILLHSCGVREHSSEDQMSTGLRNLFSNHNILYYHCGGVEANESQLARYQYASNRGS